MKLNLKVRFKKSSIYCSVNSFYFYSNPCICGTYCPGFNFMKSSFISDKQDKLNDKVTVLENRPATESKRRIDGIIDKLLWLIVG